MSKQPRARRRPPPSGPTRGSATATVAGLAGIADSGVWQAALDGRAKVLPRVPLAHLAGCRCGQAGLRKLRLKHRQSLRSNIA
jgi:hypothetical protein